MASIGTFNFDGLASGLDTKSIIEKMLSIDRLPLTRLIQDKANQSARIPILQQLNSKLLSLKNFSADLKLVTPFKTMKGASSNPLVSLSAQSSALAGTHTLDSITRLATASKAVSLSPVGGKANAGALLAENGMRTRITAGQFTINGIGFQAEATDTLTSLLGKINAKSGETGVLASHDEGRDKLVFRNAAPGNNAIISLGGAGDSSNFLTAAGLVGAFQDTASGTTEVSSSTRLGALDAAAKLADANLAEPLTSGSFKINGVTLTVDAALDSMNDLVKRINDSAAGVTAVYNPIVDRLELTNKATGATAIALEAGTSNFLDAFNLDKVDGGAQAGRNAPLLTETLGSFKPHVTPTGTQWRIRVNGTSTAWIYATDTMQQVATKLSVGGVTATYDQSAGTFRLTRATGDTSAITVTNRDGTLREALRLDNGVADASSGTMTFTSSGDISQLNMAHTLANANFVTPVAFTGGTSGTLRITRGEITRDFAYSGATTVGGLLSAINGDATLGVQAAYDPATRRFSLAGVADPGETIVAEDVESGGSRGNFATLAGFGFNPHTLGQNAEYKLNGLTYYSNSNTISDKIPGVSFTLADGIDKPVTFTVSSDASDAKNRIKAWVEHYNATLEELDGLVSDPGSVYYNDPSLRDIMNRIRSSANSYGKALPGAYKSLSDVGITSGSFGMVWSEGYIGKLEIDDAKLDAALKADPDAVHDLFFYDPNGGINYSAGVGRIFEAAMAPLTEANGTLARSETIASQRIDDLSRQIANMEAQLKVKEDYYRGIFSTLEVNMGQLQRQGQWVSQQLASLGSFGGGSGQ